MESQWFDIVIFCDLLMDAVDNQLFEDTLQKRFAYFVDIKWPFSWRGFVYFYVFNFLESRSFCFFELKYL